MSAFSSRRMAAARARCGAAGCATATKREGAGFELARAEPSAREKTPGTAHHPPMRMCACRRCPRVRKDDPLADARVRRCHRTLAIGRMRAEYRITRCRPRARGHQGSTHHPPMRMCACRRLSARAHEREDDPPSPMRCATDGATATGRRSHEGELSDRESACRGARNAFPAAGEGARMRDRPAMVRQPAAALLLEAAGAGSPLAWPAKSTTSVTRRLDAPASRDCPRSTWRLVASP